MTIMLLEASRLLMLTFRAREEITSYFSRPDLGQIWAIRLSKTAGLARLIRGFCD